MKAFSLIESDDSWINAVVRGRSKGALPNSKTIWG